MCGIAGVLNFDHSQPIDPGVLQRMCDVIAHRGPDDEGFYVNGSVGLGMRRLSIIDIDGGHQPIFSQDGSLCIVFNGEIYNHQAIRKEMIARGHVYKTQTDTESILHLYETFGVKCVEHLRGMFAFAIWDNRRRELFIARDRVGIKPLFYRVENDRLIFASEIKSILQYPGVPREIDWQALDTYFALSYITAPRTIFQGIAKLLPGHYLLWRNGNIHIEKYWELVYSPNLQAKLGDLCAEFLHVLREAVDLHMVSDVPLGAFLSGGIDSSVIVALMSERMSEPVKTFTIGFGGAGGSYADERLAARLVADRYRTSHTEMELLPRLEDGFMEKNVTAFDEPFADASSLPTYYVSQLARNQVKVALSGLGGDELLGGYERHLGLALSASYTRLPRWLRQGIVAPVIGNIPESRKGTYLLNYVKRFVQSSDLPPAGRYFAYQTLLDSVQRTALLADEVRHARLAGRIEAECGDYYHAPNATHLLDRALYHDVNVFLPDDILANTDRISMLHALEVRVPFLDHKLMEFCATIPAAFKIKGLQKKYLLKKAAADLLPRNLLHKRKQGFVGPMAMWFRHDLKDYVHDMLSETNLKTHGYLNPQSVHRILDEHFSRQKQHHKLIWALLNFQVWYQLYMTSDARIGR